ncbi:hypothetical protein BDZ89DRAFT_1051059 [Hymenopellis radicata]|nr:hypothetical protein BDZ89DRAFT_1051059 [Hymenopellis radicata]
MSSMKRSRSSAFLQRGRIKVDRKEFKLEVAARRRGVVNTPPVSPPMFSTIEEFHRKVMSKRPRIDDSPETASEAVTDTVPGDPMASFYRRRARTEGAVTSGTMSDQEGILWNADVTTKSITSKESISAAAAAAKTKHTTAAKKDTVGKKPSTADKKKVAADKKKKVAADKKEAATAANNRKNSPSEEQDSNPSSSKLSAPRKQPVRKVRGRKRTDDEEEAFSNDEFDEPPTSSVGLGSSS